MRLKRFYFLTVVFACAPRLVWAGAPIPSDTSGPVLQWRVGQAVNYRMTIKAPGFEDQVRNTRYAIVKKEDSGQFWFEVSQTNLAGSNILTISRLVTPTTETTLLGSLIFDGIESFAASRVLQKIGNQNPAELAPEMFPQGKTASGINGLYQSFATTGNGLVTTAAGAFQVVTMTATFHQSAQPSQPPRNPNAIVLVLSQGVPVRGIVRYSFPLPPDFSSNVTRTVMVEIDSIEYSASTRISGTPSRLLPFTTPSR